MPQPALSCRPMPSNPCKPEPLWAWVWMNTGPFAWCTETGLVVDLLGFLGDETVRTTRQTKSGDGEMVKSMDHVFGNTLPRLNMEGNSMPVLPPNCNTTLTAPPAPKHGRSMASAQIQQQDEHKNEHKGGLLLSARALQVAAAPQHTSEVADATHNGRDLVWVRPRR